MATLEETKMSEQDIKRAISKMKEYRKKVTSSRKSAIKSLEKAGICDSKGELTPQYK